MAEVFDVYCWRILKSYNATEEWEEKVMVSSQTDDLENHIPASRKTTQTWLTYDLNIAYGKSCTMYRNGFAVTKMVVLLWVLVFLKRWKGTRLELTDSWKNGRLNSNDPASGRNKNKRNGESAATQFNQWATNDLFVATLYVARVDNTFSCQLQNIAATPKRLTWTSDRRVKETEKESERDEYRVKKCRKKSTKQPTVADSNAVIRFDYITRRMGLIANRESRMVMAFRAHFGCAVLIQLVLIAFE